MSPEALVAAAYAALNAGDFEALLTLMDPAVEIRSLAIQSREGDWFRGYIGVRDWWDALSATYDRMSFELVELHVDPAGDRAVAELRAAFVVGDFAVETEGWQSARFYRGRILTWARWDTEAEARAAVGMEPAQ